MTLTGTEAAFDGGLREVGDGVYAWLQPNGGWGESNAGVVAGDSEAVLIDTLWDPPLTARMLSGIRSRVEVPIRTLVNTHSDGDHVWGNQLVAADEIVATAAAARAIREEGPGSLQAFKTLARGLSLVGALPLPVIGSLAVPGVPHLPVRELGDYVGRMLAPFDFSDVEVTPPTTEFSGELTVTAGDRLIRLIEVGPAHTAGDLIVHVPDARICFAGDVLFVGVTPVMWAGPPERWVAALDRVLALDADLVIPGHGPPARRQDVQTARDYFGWLGSAAESLLAGGASRLDATRSLLRGSGYTDAPWAGWGGAERTLISVATVERHLRGGTGEVGPAERIRLFAEVATLARERG